MKKLLKFTSIIFITIGLLLLLEGGFRFSVTNKNNINKLIPSEKKINNDWLVASSEKKDIIINLYYNQQDTIYILEYSKNTIFNLYSLTQINEIKTTNDNNIFNSVISSAINHYAYSVDSKKMEVKIHEPVFSENVYNSLLILFAGMSILFIQTYINEWIKHIKTKEGSVFLYMKYQFLFIYHFINKFLQVKLIE